MDPEYITMTGEIQWIKAAVMKADVKRFPIVAYTGEPLSLPNFPLKVVVDISGARFSGDRLPLTADHGYEIGSTRFGYTENHKTDENITVDGVFTSHTKEAMRVVGDIEDGIPFQASIGAAVGADKYVVASGHRVFLNQRWYEGPLIVASNALIREIAVTLLGSDHKTAVLIAAMFHGGNQMGFEKWLKDTLGLDIAAVTDAQKTMLKASWQQQQDTLIANADLKARLEAAAGGGEGAGEGGGGTTVATLPAPNTGLEGLESRLDSMLTAKFAEFEDKSSKAIEKQASELERQGMIRAFFSDPKYAEISEVEIDGKTFTPFELQAKAVRDNWTGEKVELELLRASREVPPNAFNVNTLPAGGRPEVRGDAIRASILMRQRVPDEAKDMDGRDYGLKAWFSDEALQAATSSELANISLHEIMAATIQAAQHHFRGPMNSNEFIRAAFRAQQKLDIQADGGFSSLGVTSILEDSANKALLAAYQTHAVQWPNFSSVKTLKDFKQHGFYRLTIDGGYVKVPADGQLGHGSQSDQKYPVKADTYGMLVALTRQDIKNDDLDAFMGIPTGLGRLSSLALEFAFFNSLLTWDLNAVGRQITTALGIDGLTEAQKMFDDSLDDNNKPIMADADRILVGTALKFLANELFKTDVLIATDQVAAASTRGAAKNLHAGSFTPHGSTIMSNQSTRGMDNKPIAPAANVTATQWFMGTNPNEHTGMFVGFVGGQQVPVIESGEMIFDKLGIFWRSYHDWGIGRGDSKAFVKSTGTG